MVRHHVSKDVCDIMYCASGHENLFTTNHPYQQLIINLFHQQKLVDRPDKTQNWGPRLRDSSNSWQVGMVWMRKRHEILIIWWHTWNTHGWRMLTMVKKYMVSHLTSDKTNVEPFGPRARIRCYRAHSCNQTNRSISNVKPRPQTKSLNWNLQ